MAAFSQITKAGQDATRKLVLPLQPRVGRQWRRIGGRYPCGARRRRAFSAKNGKEIFFVSDHQIDGRATFCWRR